MEIRSLIGGFALIIVLLLMSFTRKKRDIRMPIIEDRVKLLPYWIKPIAIFILIASIVGAFIKHGFELDFDINYIMFTITISMLVMALSAEKEEDELFKQLRQNAIYYSFFGTALTLLLFTAINLIFDSESFFISDKYPELKITFIQLLLYLIKFRSSKNRMKELNAIEV